MANSVDADQTAPQDLDQSTPSEAVWSGSVLFA